MDPLPFDHSVEIRVDASELLRDAASQSRITSALQTTSVPSQYWETLFRGAVAEVMERKLVSAVSCAGDEPGIFLLPLRFSRSDDGSSLLFVVELNRPLHGRPYYQSRSVVTREEGYVSARLATPTGKLIDGPWLIEVFGSQAAAFVNTSSASMIKGGQPTTAAPAFTNEGASFLRAGPGRKYHP